LLLPGLFYQPLFDKQDDAFDLKALIRVAVRRFADPTDRPLYSVSSAENRGAGKDAHHSGTLGDERGLVIGQGDGFQFSHNFRIWAAAT
jgi:hypothetical protein